jgi:hypothetical protein
VACPVCEIASQKRPRSRDALAPELCGKSDEMSPKRGGGAPRGAAVHCPAPCKPALPPACRGSRSRTLTGRARLPALHRGARQVLRPGSAPGPRFMGSGRCEPSVTPGSELLAGGRSAGRAGSQSRPSAGLRAPRAGTAPAPLQGSSREAPLNDSPRAGWALPYPKLRQLSIEKFVGAGLSPAPTVDALANNRGRNDHVEAPKGCLVGCGPPFTIRHPEVRANGPGTSRRWRLVCDFAAIAFTADIGRN